MNYGEKIKETITELQQVEKGQSKSKLKDRVRFIRYLKEGTAKTQAQAGSLIGLQERQSQQSISALVCGVSTSKKAYKPCLLTAMKVQQANSPIIK